MGRGVDLQAHIRHTKVLPLSSTRPLARSASKRSFSDGGGAAPELIVLASLPQDTKLKSNHLQRNYYTRVTSGDSEKCDCHSTRPRPRRLGYVPRIGSPSCAILYTPIGRPSRSSSTSLPRAAAYVSATLSLHSRWATTRLAVSHSRHWSCCATPMNRFIHFFSAPRSIRLAATALASGNVLVSPPLPFCDGFGGGEDMFNGSVASTYR